jgi:hypothetical protein
MSERAHHAVVQVVAGEVDVKAQPGEKNRLRPHAQAIGRLVR